VNRSSALRLLPAPHAVAIRLRDEGHGNHMIAVALEMDDDQVPMMLRVADSKLANLMAPDAVPSPQTDRSGGPHATPAAATRDEGASS
jgi:hypothetical protein